jgi:hypothetical protein
LVLAASHEVAVDLSLAALLLREIRPLGPELSELREIVDHVLYPWLRQLRAGKSCEPEALEELVQTLEWVGNDLLDLTEVGQWLKSQGRMLVVPGPMCALLLRLGLANTGLVDAMPELFADAWKIQYHAREQERYWDIWRRLAAGVFQGKGMDKFVTAAFEVAARGGSPLVETAIAQIVKVLDQHAGTNAETTQAILDALLRNPVMPKELAKNQPVLLPKCLWQKLPWSEAYLKCMVNWVNRAGPDCPSKPEVSEPLWVSARMHPEILAQAADQAIIALSGESERRGVFATWSDWDLLSQKVPDLRVGRALIKVIGKLAKSYTS